MPKRYLARHPRHKHIKLNPVGTDPDQCRRPPNKVLENQGYAREPLSLDQTIGDEGDSQLSDFITDSEAVLAIDAVSFTLLQKHLHAVLATLSKREANIIRLRFGSSTANHARSMKLARPTESPMSASGKSNARRWPSCAIRPAPKPCATTSTNTVTTPAPTRR